MLPRIITCHKGRSSQRRVQIVQTMNGFVPPGILLFASGLLSAVISCALEQPDSGATYKWGLHGREVWKDI